jgi:lipoprotein NlpI
VGQPGVEDDGNNNVVTVSMTYSIPKMATERSGNWFVRYSATNIKGSLAPPPPASRIAPLQQPSFPYSAAYTFEIKLPDAISMVADPRATTIKNKYFSYSLAAHFRGNVSKNTVDLRVTGDQVPTEDFKRYADDVRAIDSAGQGLVIIPKAAIKPISAAKKDFSATLRERLKQQIEKTTQSIKSGKLGATDLASAYCMRSAAHGELGSPTEALADANEALKLDPLSPDILHCRGYAYFGAGEFDKSIADFSKAITLGANERTLQQRGIARFYAGLLEAAAEDFAKAGETTDKEAQVYSDLWLAWTYQRLGKALPEDVVARGGQANGAWPRPALAMLTGKLTPGELIKLIERKTGDEGKMTACEGYFYLGQYFLVHGDAAKARELFQKTRQTNVLPYNEYQAAAFELRRLSDAAPPSDASPAAKAQVKRTKPAVDARPKKSTANETDWRAGALGQ